MASISYSTVGSNKLEAAKTFYDALLGSIGMKPIYEHPSGVGNGSLTGFSFDTTGEIDAFHAKALELGATNEGDPGERGPGVYFGYFRDLDGNKLCGYKFG